MGKMGVSNHSKEVTMTPVEKAKQLFEAYLEIGMGDGWAKQCALIVAKEVRSTHYDAITVMWWDDVIKEIEKL